jgi:cytochrome c oxidase subunit IV
MSEPKSANSKPEDKNGDNYTNAFIGVFADILFILLPLLVIALVSIHKCSTLWNFLSSPEISFAAAIMIGQTIVKFVSGVSVYGANIWERIAVMVAAMIVIFLVPTLIVLALIMTSVAPAPWLVWTQLIYFILSVLLFATLGSIGSSLIKEKGI